MKSIRIFLVAVILAVFSLYNFLAALEGYQYSMAEAERLFDKQLLDTAKLIASLHIEDSRANIDQNSAITYQVWQQDHLISSSDNVPATAIAPLDYGFNYSNFGGYRWRTVTYFNTESPYWVIVAERTDLRYTLAENVILESVFPIILGLPVIGLLIWLIVSQGLKPLRRLATELGNKQPHDLSPLSARSTSHELKQIVRSSNKLLKRLEGSLLRERQFASDAAHELRTPISALKVQLHNISKEIPTDNQNIRELVVSTERLGHIVEQILDLHRSSPDQFNASFTSHNLAGLVTEVMAQEHHQFESKNQKLEFDGKPCKISGDRFALVTLLQNLLSNANKYTPFGGEVLVSTTESEGRVVLTVEDSGSGIEKEQHEAIFRRFYRIGGDRHQSGVPGCGLGLAIVQGIVELHDASITISSSRFETGTAFHVNFPVDESTKPAVAYS